jgi:gas vesicle protein
VAQNLALLGVGVAVGAGVALLLAPASGSETRKRLGKSVERLSERAAEKLEQVQELASSASARTNGDSNNKAVSAREI